MLLQKKTHHVKIMTDNSCFFLHHMEIAGISVSFVSKRDPCLVLFQCSFMIFAHVLTKSKDLQSVKCEEHRSPGITVAILSETKTRMTGFFSNWCLILLFLLQVTTATHSVPGSTCEKISNKKV